MKFRCLLVSIALLSTQPLLNANMGLLNIGQNAAPQLVVNNRIVAKVNDKTISVLDIMKKMDVFIARYYPQYSDNVHAKYQYFNTHWKDVLTQIIDSELMLLDAEKLELKVSDSDVREALLERFGPNIMVSLDKLQLSYEEAKKMVHTDLIVERMTWYRIHSKALQSVNPNDIKLAYADYLQKNPPQEEWEYQVVSVRAKNEEIGKDLVNKAHSLIATSKYSLSEVIEQIKANVPENSGTSISLSEDFKTNSKTISETHKQVLINLMVDSISAPIRQLSKADQSVVYRLFYLKDHSKILPESFSKISEKLKQELLNESASKESRVYLEKLRSKFGYDMRTILEDIPKDFHPFEIK
ncbi:MAG: hypothetical protein FJZ57_02700 [Chlamydiae bacterium]|nr:hypothetical protein [Chlamydiota bacterium]